MTQDFYKGCYGAKATASEIREWIKTSLIRNIERRNAGLPPCSINIWGPPGFGKTSIVKSLVNDKVEMSGQSQAIRVIDIPLAQIEETGDLLGFPVEQVLVEKLFDSNGNVLPKSEKEWIKAADSVISRYIQDGWELTTLSRTTYAPPAWVPKEECPGILLFDDANRASQRIMKSLMQLIQDGKTISWALPKGWMVVFTGNPDNRYNQVTSMDTAQLSRMKHITLEVDAKEWALWAQENQIDKRGVNFVLRYPEMIVGKERTNPRSLTEFFYTLKNYPDLNDAKAFRNCMIEASASLDEETVTVLGTFLVRDTELVIDPEMILDDIEKAEQKVKDLMNKTEPRIDIISVTMDRLVAYLLANGYEPKDSHIENFKRWMLFETIPKDLTFSTMSRIANSGWKYCRKFIAGKEMLDMVLDLFKKD